MTMCITPARQATRLSGAPQAQRNKAKCQRHRAARPRTPAPKRTARTRALSESATSWLTPTTLTTLLTGVAVIATTVVQLQGTIKEGFKALESKQDASTSELQLGLAKLVASNNAFISELDASISVLRSELDASISVLNTKLDANTASIREVNTKLDALSANVQAQQVQTADLKGQVGVLRDTNNNKK